MSKPTPVQRACFLALAAVFLAMPAGAAAVCSVSGDWPAFAMAFVLCFVPGLQCFGEAVRR